MNRTRKREVAIISRTTLCIDRSSLKNHDLLIICLMLQDRSCPVGKVKFSPFCLLKSGLAIQQIVTLYLCWIARPDPLPLLFYRTFLSDRNYDGIGPGMCGCRVRCGPSRGPRQWPRSVLCFNLIPACERLFILPRDKLFAVIRKCVNPVTHAFVRFYLVHQAM